MQTDRQAVRQAKLGAVGLWDGGIRRRCSRLANRYVWLQVGRVSVTVNYPNGRLGDLRGLLVKLLTARSETSSVTGEKREFEVE